MKQPRRLGKAGQNGRTISSDLRPARSDLYSRIDFSDKLWIAYCRTCQEVRIAYDKGQHYYALGPTLHHCGTLEPQLVAALPTTWECSGWVAKYNTN